LSLVRCCFFNHVKASNAELNPICHLMALLRSHSILHVSRIRVNSYRLTWSPTFPLHHEDAPRRSNRDAQTTAGNTRPLIFLLLQIYLVVIVEIILVVSSLTVLLKLFIRQTNITHVIHTLCTVNLQTIQSVLIFSME
jgi:hypothetical protein